MSKQRRQRLNRNKHIRSHRSFIRNGVEQLESRVLPGGFLDLLAGATIAFTLDLLPEEQLVPEEFERDSVASAQRTRSVSPILPPGLSLPEIDLELRENRAAQAPSTKSVAFGTTSPATTSVLSATTLIDTFFTSNEFVTSTATHAITPSPPLANSSPSFSSSISQLGSGVGTGSGQGYNVTGAEFPQSSADNISQGASSMPAWMIGEGEGSASGSSSGSSPASSPASPPGSSSYAPPPPPVDPCLAVPAPSITINAVPTGVKEMDVITISGTVENGYPNRPDMGSKWMTTEWQSDYAGAPSTWSISGFYMDDGDMSIAMTGGYVCGNAAASAMVAVANVAPTIVSAPGSSISEGDEAVLTVQYSDATNDYGYSSESWTLTVDWGDGETSSYADDRSGEMGDGGSGMGLGAAAGSYIPTWEHTFRHVYKDDAYGDSPTPNEIANYPVTVMISDGTDTDIKASIITVNNVAPTVTITSITPIDSVSEEKGGVDGRLDETEGFVVRGTVTDPGLLATFPVANIEVDLNFDGDVEDDGERVPVPLMQVGPGNYRFEMTIAKVLDDGAVWRIDPLGNRSRLWGNGTESDPLTVTPRAH